MGIGSNWPSPRYKNCTRVQLSERLAWWGAPKLRGHHPRAFYVIEGFKGVLNAAPLRRETPVSLVGSRQRLYSFFPAYLCGQLLHKPNAFPFCRWWGSEWFSLTIALVRWFTGTKKMNFGCFRDFWKMYFIKSILAEERNEFPVTNATEGRSVYTQRNLFGILLNQTQIRLYLPCTDWFGTKLTVSVWFQINRKIINPIWFRFYLIRFLCV